MSSIDYKQPLEDDSYFQDYLKSKAETLKKTNQATRPQSSHMWALIFVLMISLVGLGITALLQYQNTQQLLARYETADVAGANEGSIQIQNIITAEGFSIVLDEPTPEEYKLNRSTEISKFVPEIQSTTTSLIAPIDVSGVTVQSGISVEVTEYDNKLTKEEFAEQVAQQLGEDYVVIGDEVSIPKDYSVTKIKNNGATTDNIEYYTTVTSSNYYVIKVYMQTAQFPELISNTRFSDTLLQNVYLN